MDFPVAREPVRARRSIVLEMEGKGEGELRRVEIEEMNLETGVKRHNELCKLVGLCDRDLKKICFCELRRQI